MSADLNKEIANHPQFTVPVDTEHKSTRLRIWSFQRPHHLAFQMSWMAFFAAFVSTFAPAAVLPLIRENLDLTKTVSTSRLEARVCSKDMP
jgi:hypothetical protein